MWLKWLFDKVVAFIGLALLWPVLKGFIAELTLLFPYNRQ